MSGAGAVLRWGTALLRVLSSPLLLAWLLVGWIVYYVLLSVWNPEAFATFVGGLSHSLALQGPSVLFLVSGYFNLLAAATRLVRRQRPARLMFLVVPLGILLFLTGMFISLTTRQFDWLFVGKGHEVRTRWDGASYRVTSIEDGLRDRFLDTEVGGEGGTGFFKYEPKITLQDLSSRAHDIGAFPPVRVSGTYFHILNFGLAPGLRLLQDGQLKDEGYMPLRIISPGSSDTFEIAPYPFRFVLSLEPDKTYQKGVVEAHEFNVRTPLYKVKVFEGEKVIAEEVSRTGIRFGSYALEFLEPTTWVQLEAVKDHGVPAVLAGIILLVAGVPLAAVTALILAARRRAGRPLS